MQTMDIIRRIASGELVVYLQEEYGFREWFWFPECSEEELLSYWSTLNAEDHFMSPAGLCGTMVVVSGEDQWDQWSDGFLSRDSHPHWAGHLHEKEDSWLLPAGLDGSKDRIRLSQ